MIVFDASTLILLARTDLLEAFVSDYDGETVVPDKVRDEVMQKEGSGTPQIARLIETGKVEVVKAKDKILIHNLINDFNIDAGEAEAIAVALHKKGAVVATDDRNAIRACRFLKIEFIGALAILIRAAEKNLIDKDVAVLKLERLESIGRYRKSIIADALRRLRGGV